MIATARLLQGSIHESTQSSLSRRAIRFRAPPASAARRLASFSILYFFLRVDGPTSSSSFAAVHLSRSPTSVPGSGMNEGDAQCPEYRPLHSRDLSDWLPPYLISTYVLGVVINTKKTTTLSSTPLCVAGQRLIIDSVHSTWQPRMVCPGAHGAG
jgi:hypothetical protein